MSAEIRVSTPQPQAPAEGLTLDRFRTIVQDSHLNFLIGAGTSAPFFAPLGDVEKVLTSLPRNTEEAALARASVQRYFFDSVLVPNLRLLADPLDAEATSLIKSYARFYVTLNQILLKRRNSLLGKQVNVFTTNVDMVSEVALERFEIALNDGFVGKINPRLDLGEISAVRLRQGAHYEYRSEVPTVNLFKLHGSASWRGVGDDIYFDHGLTLTHDVQAASTATTEDLLSISGKDEVDRIKLLAAAKGKTRTQAVKDFTAVYNRLRIVNPEKTKFANTVLEKTYYELIRRFSNELEKENCVLFAHGFSFRDEHLLDLVVRAASSNPTLLVVIFCYDRDSKTSVEAQFPQERMKNQNIVFVQPATAAKSEDERKITLDVLVEDYLSKILGDTLPGADSIIELRLATRADGHAHA